MFRVVERISVNRVFDVSFDSRLKSSFDSRIEIKRCLQRVLQMIMANETKAIFSRSCNRTLK